MLISFEKKTVIEHVVILLLLFVGASPIIPTELRVTLLLVLMVFLHFSSGSVRLNKVSRLFVFLFSCLFLCYLIVDLFNVYYFSLNTLSFLYIPLCFYCGVVLAGKYNYRSYMVIYENVIFFLAISSLFFYTLVLIFPGILNVFFDYRYYNFSSKSIVILNVLTSDFGMIKRNSGFASEPGLYQVFLNIALWWRLIIRSKFDFRVLIYAVSIISTNSTVGLLTMGMLFFIGGKGKVKLMAFCFFAAAIFFGWGIIEYHISSKLAGSASFAGRLEPFINAFEFSFKHPLGIGSIEYTRLLELEKFGGWDSFSQMVLRYGYWGLLLLLLLSLSIVNYSLTLTMIIVFSFFSQSIWYIPSIVVLFFMSTEDS